MAASSAEGVTVGSAGLPAGDAAGGATGSLTGDWMASSCERGSEAAGSANSETRAGAPDGAGAGEAEDDGGLPG
ncbi:hypothetical protein [Paraburkholderia ginsengiterrae]|uniref:hypothetical protein n=1 Tax=Paraburkholderia ginsengiterrae TaxID=1462993 RepID=UPI001F60E805|nr:hypothetical protein [Paraburkholderia ginsengiterrae]